MLNRLRASRQGAPGVAHGASVERNAQQVTSLIRDAIEANALSWPDFDQALRYHLSLQTPSLTPAVSAAILDAAKQVVVEESVPDIHGLGLLATHVQAMLDVEFPPQALAALLSRAGRVRRAAVTLFASMLFSSVIYLVLGGLVSGESALISHWLPALALFLALLMLLAAVEALHISVTLLRLKDPYDSRNRYPRTYRLHQVFRSKEGTDRFLAGRQFMVIVTVFFMAQLTSFPEMRTWPLTETSFPGWLAPWLTEVFLRLGVAGALLVLWIGQLAPQFVANARPQWFMNLRPIGWLFRFALFLEALGLTRPGTWLSRWAKKEPEIPQSPQERYRQAVEQIEGLGTLGIRKQWEVRRNRANVEYVAGASINRAGVFDVVDAGLQVRLESPVHVRLGEDLLSTHGDLRPTESLVEEEQDEQSVRGWRLLRRKFRPRFGAFRPGLVVVSRAWIEGPHTNEDAFHVVGPTKFLLFRLRLVETPYQMRGGHVSVYRAASLEEVTDDRQLPLVEERDLEIVDLDDGTVGLEYTVFYPDVMTYHYITWQAEYRRVASASASGSPDAEGVETVSSTRDEASG